MTSATCNHSLKYRFDEWIQRTIIAAHLIVRKNPLVNKHIRVENGIVVGTASDKYESRNPLARMLVNGFDRAIVDLAVRADPKTIVEVGCGEGHVTNLLLSATLASLQCFDISDAVLDEARRVVTSDRVRFGLCNIYDLEPPSTPPDLVVCCEVLEHLDDPERGLDRLVSLNAAHYLISVPREPIWRTLNFLRGAYVSDFGNSPGHVQHWSKSGFVRFLSSRLDVIQTRSPLPWTVVLARPSNGRKQVPVTA